MSPSKLNKSLLTLCGLLVCGLAWADADEEYTGPTYRFGGVKAYPGLGIVEKSDSNILRLNDSDPNKISSNVTVLSPSLVLKAMQSANIYSLSYLADIGRYDSSSIDNYTDQRILGLASFGLPMQSTFKILPEYVSGHDDRGTTYGGFTTTTPPNTWHSTGLKVSYLYGAEDTLTNAALDLGYADKQYQNNRSLTSAYDRTLTDVGGTFYFRVQPKTQLLLNAKYTAIAYAQDGSLLNGNEQRILIGAKWEATAQTTGEVKVGQLKKNFDTTYPTYTGGSWEGNVRWSPLSYVNVDVVSSKQPVETTLTGSSAILVSNTGANLGYDLNDRVTLSANGYQVNEDFVGAGRNDSTNIYGLKTDYKFRKWLIGGFEYSNSRKSSSDPLNDYNRNIFMLRLRSELN